MTKRRTEADGGWNKQTRSAGRAKTKYTDTLTRGSGEVREEGKEQVKQQRETQREKTHRRHFKPEETQRARIQNKTQ